MKKNASKRLLALCALAALLAVGCTRGPDEQAVRQEVESRLAEQVEPGLFEVQSLRRMGSAPLPAGEQGAARVVVYYNALLRLAQDYEFGGWEQLGPASVAYVLGATEQGIFGITAHNQPGDIVRVFGSVTYEQSDDRWVAVLSPPGATPPVPETENTAPPSQSKQMIDKLASLVLLPPPGINPDEDEIIAAELARAAESIDRRIARRKHVFTIASGPTGGQYARFGAALVDSVAKTAPTLTLRHRTTQGSVENVWLLAQGEADYALVQSDVAARAVAGEGVFAGGRPLGGLRALGSLFPEPVHVVVLADSPIKDVADLRGKRVDIGTPASGTQFNALAVLAAHGMQVADLAEAVQDGPEPAMDRLRDGLIDAFFVTVAVPLPPLQDLAAGTGIRLLPLQEAAIDRLVSENPGLVALTLPAGTYPGQTEAVPTVAATALLVTTNEAPETEVERVVDHVFVRMPALATGAAATYKLSKETALQGITIPLHPGASRALE
jgi:TRAP transporter TAXI family solute receptor